MASQVGPNAGTLAAHVCPQCSKSFVRLCDLNKHSKSHTRPYKCKDPTCKYHTFGWPTAKELERHNNDKHSATPRTFPCLFRPCTYWSKRESNCKQHMEKAHNWEYVRSKSKGSRAVAQQKLDDDGYPLNNHGMMLDTDLRNTPASASPRSLITPPAGVDFILFDDQEDAIGDHDDNLYSHYADAHNVESYLPWTSPTTRLRDNELVLERFSQTYNSMQANASTAVGTYGVGPGLALSNFPSHGLQHYPKIGHPVPFTANVTIKVESPILTLDTAIPRKRKYEPVEAPLAHLEQVPASTSSMRPNPSQKTGAGQGTPTPSRARPASKCENSSGEDVGRPKKKTKPNSTEDFDDMSMPDIFRHAHPTLYDKDRSDKYSPCHTVHREISTLV
jgi:uncharacterized C2H2 Zn-finger protein